MSTRPTTTDAARPLLVVFDAGRWYSTPPGSDTPVPLDADRLDDFFDLSLSAGATVESGVEEEAAPPDATTVTLPGPVLLARRDGRLVAWDHDGGRTVELDAGDIALVSLPFPATVGALRGARHDAATRLRRLRKVGLVEFQPGSPAATNANEAKDSTAGMNGSADPSAPARSPAVLARRLLRTLLDRVNGRRGQIVSGAYEQSPAEPGTGATEGVEEPGTGATEGVEEPGALTGTGRAAINGSRSGPAAGPADTPAALTDRVPSPIDDVASGANHEAPHIPGAVGVRTRVLASWDIETWGQPLALGSLLAYARVHDRGQLNSIYDIRRVLTHGQLLEELRGDGEPAVVLFSDYIWSANDNLTVAEQVKRLDSRHLVVHGGPHVPKYRADSAAHFDKHPYVDVTVHGEGEITLAELLGALGGDPTLLSALSDVAGLTVREGGSLASTAERERHDRLEDFPSAYLTGEFDHLDPSHWQWPSIETDRGCPYSCTFCDWGSATRSRIRTFPLERVRNELRWIAERGLPHWMINDANFGIHQRDVEIARYIVELREEFGVPNALYVNYAKNTVKHLAEIIRMLTAAGITGEGALALQTRDATTLKAIKRQNIRVDKYDELADEFRKYGLPLVTDLIIGLPGQTVSSFLDDMQYCVDNDVTPRFFVSLNLPNAEMNDPAYRERFGIVLGDGDVVVATNSFTREDRQRMMRLRMAYRCFEHLGTLRHFMRYLQWDHGIPASEVMDRFERCVNGHPEQYPLLSWMLGYLDIFLVPPFSWSEFYAEALELIADEFGVVHEALETVTRVQLALMPHRFRSFPLTVELPHDYVAWYLRNLAAQRSGDTSLASLGDQPPGVFTVAGDPIYRCRDALCRVVEERPHELLTGPFWVTWNWELDSPLQRLVPETAVEEAAKQRESAAGPSVA
jgi:radical SAM superfamily enzyme YgiQ (UPF0313 family)